MPLYRDQPFVYLCREPGKKVTKYPWLLLMQQTKDFSYHPCTVVTVLYHVAYCKMPKNFSFHIKPCKNHKNSPMSGAFPRLQMEAPWSKQTGRLGWVSAPLGTTALGLALFRVPWKKTWLNPYKYIHDLSLVVWQLMFQISTQWVNFLWIKKCPFQQSVI